MSKLCLTQGPQAIAQLPLPPCGECLTCKPNTFARIEYDYDQKTVTVTRHSLPSAGIDDNDRAEQAAAKGDRKINTVYIEADKIDDLKEAYPNYFGDVQVFNSNLKSIIQGKGVIEFTQAPRVTVPPPPKEPADHSWFRPGKRRQWAEPAKPPRKPGRS